MRYNCRDDLLTDWRCRTAVDRDVGGGRKRMRMCGCRYLIGDFWSTWQIPSRDRVMGLVM